MKKLLRISLVLITLLLSPFIFAENLRPGDIIKIKFPGEENFNKSFQLDLNGQINLPEIGSVDLKGKSIHRAKFIIVRRLKEVYKDLSRFSLQLQERRLSITVLGYVKRPGSVNLAANANVQMAINKAGGLAQGAQLNKLQIRRDKKIILFDFKQYLDTGNTSALPQLKPMDIIFVPASPLIGNVQVDFDARTLLASGDAGAAKDSVTVFGEVHRPGTFSYKGEANIVDMIMRSGGVTRYAGIEQIRVIHQGKPFPFNMREYLDTGDKKLMPKIHRGDVIFVPQATDQVQSGSRTAYVIGEVFKPGALEMKPGTNFLDLLATAGGPTRFAETRQIRILHASGRVSNFDLQRHMDGKTNGSIPKIKPGDAILVPEKTDMNEKSWLKISPDRAVRIIGAVNRPGRYEWASEMTLLDLIAHAGGPVAAADTSHLQVLHASSGFQVKNEVFDLKKFLEKGGDIRTVPVIKAGDTVVIPELPKDPNDNRSQWVRQSSDRSIYIMGAVGAPGRYAFNSELNFLDILSAAQGPTQQADLSNIRITHRASANGKKTVSSINLHLYFQNGNDSLLPIVKNEDVIFIPDRNRAWLEKPKESMVRVLGAVARPGRYSFASHMTVLDLLAEAGGPHDTALQDSIMIVRQPQIGSEKTQAIKFDLVAFARHADFSKLPIINAGDTLYVPSREQSRWYRFINTLRDSISVLSFARLVGL
ncbi:MAG: SLBB domain-containing protein [Oceanospirillaceae bacterium]|nr:SLBB domain-containing protein [Oceanospirillaceae bacterium]